MDDWDDDIQWGELFLLRVHIHFWWNERSSADGLSGKGLHWSPISIDNAQAVGSSIQFHSWLPTSYPAWAVRQDTHGWTHIRLAVLTSGQFLCQTISVVSQYFTTWKRKPLAILHTVYKVLWCDAITMVIDGSFAKRWHQSSHGDDYCLPWRPIHCQVCCSIDRFNLNPESLIKSVGSWDREFEVDFPNTRYVINCKTCKVTSWPQDSGFKNGWNGPWRAHKARYQSSSGPQKSKR